MKLHRLWLNNGLRNYHYIAECEQSGEAAVFDPFDVDMIMQCVQQNNLKVTTIFNTHEHADHIQGNAALKKQTGARIVAPDFALFDADEKVKEGDEIRVGETLRFTSWFTPGHTMHHFSFFNESNDKARLFCGDVIFNAGAGNVNSGDAATLYKTFNKLLETFPDKTEIFSGHDYFETNLKFALSLEPDNDAAKQRLNTVQGQSAEERDITSLAEEKAYNPFLRLDNATIQQSLVTQGLLDENDKDNAEKVFVALRKARNNW